MRVQQSENTSFLDGVHIRMGEAVNYFLHGMSAELAGSALAELTGTISVPVDMASVNNGPQQQHLKGFV
jgi:hypothetical protein